MDSDEASQNSDGPRTFRGGRYVHMRLLATGGMGEVYEALDTALHKKVAVKLLRGDTWGESQFVRFQREAQVLARLSHPNIGTIFDFGVEDGQPYMVLELIGGTDINGLLKKNGKVSVDEVLEIGVQVCAALGHAHAKGIVHRDIKPGNIMVSGKDGMIEVKIVDFGIAKLVEAGDGNQAMTEVGAIVGSPLFMSPEQVKRDTITARSDLYSFGCLLFLLLTGSPPFHGETAIDTASMHLNTQPPTLPKVSESPTIQNGLAAAIQRCLEKNPRMRFQSAQDLSYVFEGLLQFSLEKEGPVGERSQMLPPIKKSHTDRYIALAVAGVIVITTGWFIQSMVSSINKKDNSRIYKDPAFSNPVGSEEFYEVKSYDGESIRALSDQELLRMEMTELRLILDDVTDEQFMRFSRLKKLESVEFDQCRQFTGSSFSHLKCKAELQRLCFKSCTKLNPVFLKSLKDYKALIRIEFSDPTQEIDGAIIDSLASPPDLTQLSLAHCRFFQTAKERFRSFSSLNSFSVGWSNLTDVDFQYLDKMKRLVSLSVDGCPVTGEFLDSLACQTVLIDLSMVRCTRLESRYLKLLSKFQCLEKLSLDDNRITAATIKALSSAPRLKTLSLAGCRIQPSALPSLSSLTRLENLSLRRTLVTDEVLAHLPSKLKLLELSKNDLTDESLAAFQKKFPDLNIKLEIEHQNDPLALEGESVDPSDSHRELADVLEKRNLYDDVEQTQKLFEPNWSLTKKGVVTGDQERRCLVIVGDAKDNQAVNAQRDALEMMTHMLYGSVAVSGRNVKYLHQPFFDALSKQSKLRRIILFNAADEDVAKFSHLPQLKQLFLRDCRLAGDSFKIFDTLPQLEHIVLQRCAGIKPENLKTLERVKRLKIVEYNKGRLDRNHLKALAALPIKSLGLKDSSYPVGSLSELMKSRSLISLDLQNTGVSDVDAHYLARVPLLHTVKLTDCSSISQSAIDFIAKTNKRVILDQESPLAP